MKQTLALALALVLLLAMPTTVLAGEPRIEGFRDNKTLADGYLLSGSGKVKTDTSRQTVTYQKPLKPGERDRINLTQDLFEWEDDNWVTLDSAVLRDNMVSAHTVFTEGEEAVDRVSIDTRQREIVIQYAQSLVSTEPVSFSFNVHLVINGKRYADRGITFSGTVENPVVAVDNATTIDLSGGKVVEARADIASIRMKLGDAAITTNLQKGGKYYAACSASALPAGNELLQKHPSLARSVTMHTVGIDSDQTTVKLAKEYADYYVYDRNLNYLGRGDTQLPYRSRYYLSKSKLKV